MPRGDRDAMEEFISNLKILLGAVGYKALESISKFDVVNTQIVQESPEEQIVSNSVELTLKVKGVEATAALTDEGLVVQTGSTVSMVVKDSLSNGYRQLRDQLIDNGTLEEAGAGFKFTKNHLFKSPSQAAAIIVGYAINGRHHWQTSEGRTIKQIEESGA